MTYNNIIKKIFHHTLIYGVITYSIETINNGNNQKITIYFDDGDTKEVIIKTNELDTEKMYNKIKEIESKHK